MICLSARQFELPLRSLDKRMPRGYTDHKGMIRMNENEMLQTILSEIKSMNGEIASINKRLDGLEAGQKDMRAEMNGMRAEINDMHAEMKEVNRRLDTLEEGQKTIRRDVARVERKVDRLGNDVGDTLAIVTEATDYEISKLREAK